MRLIAITALLLMNACGGSDTKPITDHAAGHTPRLGRNHPGSLTPARVAACNSVPQ